TSTTSNTSRGPRRSAMLGDAQVELFREGGELVRDGVASELLQGLCLDLPDALARHSEDLPYLLESMISRIANSETHAQDPLLAWCQLCERFSDGTCKSTGLGRRLRVYGILRLDQVAERGIAVFSNREIE